MTSPWLQEADAQFDAAKDWLADATNNDVEMTSEERPYLVATAQVHATLALAAAVMGNGNAAEQWPPPGAAT